MSFSRWWSILRHHRPSQLFWRGASIVRRRVFPLLPHSRYTDVDSTSVIRRENTGFEAIVARHLRLCEESVRKEAGCETASGERSRVDELLMGEFEFLNEKRLLPSPIDWELTTVEPVSHLWRFHLHSHAFLLELLKASREQGVSHAKGLMWAIVSDWIDANPIDRPGALNDAWHPFCLSKRIAVWLMLWHASEPPVDLRDRFAASLEGQIRYLERHLEWDLRGNHLLENARTLAMAGAFFEGVAAERRLEVADQVLCEQLVEQVLPSGEHFERSPMYHAQMLSAVLDVRDAVRSVRPDLATTCEEVSGQMAVFLKRILHPDGGIPLLADSALGETPDVAVLLAAAGGDAKDQQAAETVRAQAVGDYWTWQDGGDFLLMDAGPVGADELPAHAHCDLLTLEASFDDRRVFVDSGVFDYSDGEMRRYCRSTAAHNVLQVDGVEQCDMWSRFRLGYRGHPSPLEHGQSGPFEWCRASHDAYRRIGVPVVGRWLACRTGGPWLCVDWANGTERHELTTRLHLAMDVKVTLESPQSALLTVGKRLLQVQSLTAADISIESGWSCPDFGVRQQTSVLTLTSTVDLPACVAWVVQDVGGDGGVSVQTNLSGQVVVRWQDGDGQITWDVTAAQCEGIVRNAEASQEQIATD